MNPPQDLFIVFLLFVPAYLALGARSFEYYSAIRKADSKVIETFLANLSFPLK